MSGIVYFFSIWLLLLTGIPCPDAECHAQSTQAAHANDGHGHKAPCSPFCHCTTCPGFAIPRLFSYAQLAPLVVINPSGQAFTYQSPSQIKVVQSVWQPPRQ